MSFQFDFKDRNELNPFGVIKEGEGTFKIIEIEEKVSRAENPMLVLKMRLGSDDGKTTLCMHYILKNEYTAEKIYRICVAANAEEVYMISRGDLDPVALLGLKGRCMIKTESSVGFDDKSRVDKFIPHKETAATGSSHNIIDPNDSLPF